MSEYVYKTDDPVMAYSVEMKHKELGTNVIRGNCKLDIGIYQLITPLRNKDILN